MGYLNRTRTTMSDVSLASRVMLAQVIGRVCFPQNHASLLCKFKSRGEEGECDDEIEEKLECQKAMIDDFEDVPSFVKYRDCLEANDFHFDVCQVEKEQLTDYIQTTQYRYV